MEKIVSLEDAKKNNLKYYFTGKKCRNNHIAKRRTNTRVCLKCETLKSIRWRKKQIKKPLTAHQKELKKAAKKRWRDKLKNDPIRYRKFLDTKIKYSKTDKSKSAIKKYKEKNNEKIKLLKKLWWKNLTKEQKQKYLLLSKKWREKNSERVKKRFQNWKLNLTDEQREIQRIKLNKYVRERKKTDPNFKLSQILRTQLYKALYSKNAVKENRALELLGVQIKYFRKYLEHRFKKGMTWENYGSVWHIDHIIPLSIIDISKEENLKFAFHYRNLQPMFARENIQKSNKIFIPAEKGDKLRDMDVKIKKILKRVHPEQELDFNIITTPIDKRGRGVEIIFKRTIN